MKKIFYICTKPIENLDFFAPLDNMAASQSQISVLLLAKDQDLQNIYASQVWKLDSGELDLLDTNAIKSISYQKFLEQIFLHDLPMVI